MKLFLGLEAPPAASVLPTSPRLRRGSLCRIAASTLMRAGMSFVSQQEVLCSDDRPMPQNKRPALPGGPFV